MSGAGNPRVLNPDSTILQQVDGHWQKLAALILWKTMGRDKPVVITTADIEAMHKAFAPGTAVVLTHGHSDSIEFRLIDEAAAVRLAAHEATQRGHAAGPRMTIYSKAQIKRTYEALLPECLADREAAIEATADRLGISTNDVLEALAPETEQC